MPDPVFIGVEDAADGADLVRCLSRHGLSAGLVPAGPSWVEALRGDGELRGDALRRLRRHLAAVATFELERRGIGGDDGLRPDSLSLVRDAAEAALAAVLADLDRYRGQSAFTTWTAKYAIREAAAASRATRIASRSTSEE